MFLTISTSIVMTAERAHDTRLVGRLRDWMRRPPPGRLQAVRFRAKRILNRTLPWVPLPVRLPFGGWWLAWNDVCGDGVFTGVFEVNECRFVERFLQPGMTVVDAGAHHGLYALLASNRVGPQGRVIAFEPSPRERRKLRFHLWINRCSNVHVAGSALASSVGQRDLFFVKGRDTGCNSLRPPAVADPTQTLRVPVVTLDSYVQQHGIGAVDFIKLDVEGAELEVLKGAAQLLQRRPRPVVLCEVQDVRTRPWGYKAAEILECLRSQRYRWFRPLPNGEIKAVASVVNDVDANLVAVAEERMGEIKHLIQPE